MINAFDEFTGCWFYDIPPHKLLWGDDVVEDRYKVIKCIMSSPRLKKWRIDKVRRGPLGYVYEDQDIENWHCVMNEIVELCTFDQLP